MVLNFLLYVVEHLVYVIQVHIYINNQNYNKKRERDSIFSHCSNLLNRVKIKFKIKLQVGNAIFMY